MIHRVQALVLNFLVFFQGFLFLYDGGQRNQFIESYCQFNKKCRQDGQLLEISIVVIALLIMMVAFVENLFTKMISYFVAIFQACFCYNVAINYDSKSLTILISHLLVIIVAVKLNIQLQHHMNDQIQANLRKSHHHCPEDQKNWNEQNEANQVNRPTHKKNHKKKHHNKN